MNRFADLPEGRCAGPMIDTVPRTLDWLLLPFIRLADRFVDTAIKGLVREKMTGLLARVDDPAPSGDGDKGLRGD